MILAIAPMIAEGLIIYNRDVEQAFTQSKTAIIDLSNLTYRQNSVMKWVYPKIKLLFLNLPLYGVPESGNHWYNTYHMHHSKNLGLIKSSYDPCLLIRIDNEYSGMIGV